MSDRGIPFEEGDLTEPDNLAAAKALGHSSAPVVVVGDRSWSGFRPDFLDEIAERVKE
ncbi:glutaredoxin [Microbacterium resistens]|uniref:Glutaredoxin n=1 Tax=Microbacterium resistens TaxID=156977 RepID=A0ABU1SFX3_9MICO|nr:glutaredoxin [Microbacterium resistens]